MIGWARAASSGWTMMHMRVPMPPLPYWWNELSRTVCRTAKRMFADSSSGASSEASETEASGTSISPTTGGDSSISGSNGGSSSTSGSGGGAGTCGRDGARPSSGGLSKACVKSVHSPGLRALLVMTQRMAMTPAATTATMAASCSSGSLVRFHSFMAHIIARIAPQRQMKIWYNLRQFMRTYSHRACVGVGAEKVSK